MHIPKLFLASHDFTDLLMSSSLSGIPMFMLSFDFILQALLEENAESKDRHLQKLEATVKLMSEDQQKVCGHRALPLKLTDFSCNCLNI